MSCYPWSIPTRVIRFSVPFVRGKQRPRHSKGRVYTPAPTRRAEKAIRDAYKLCADGLPPAPKDWPVAVEITVRKKLQISCPKCVTGRFDYTKPDLDNVGKLVLDALNGAAYEDDKQVVDLRVVRALRRRGWRDQLDVTVTVPNEWDPSKNDIRDGGSR